MKDTWMKKGLVVSIILLFIGVAVAPSINQSVVKASDEDDFSEMTTETCNSDRSGDFPAQSTPLANMAENWTEMQQLLASDGTARDRFGSSVSIDGDAVLIGAENDDAENGSGSAYVFIRNNSTWTLQAKLIPLDGTSGNCFGNSVSLDGDTALIGAVASDGYTGSAYVFIRNGTTWIQQQKLFASDGVADDWFGCSVSLNGDTALIGAMDDDSGSAYVFTRTNNTWRLQEKILATDGKMGDFFGESVSLSEDTALIGASGDDDSGGFSGSTYVFTRMGDIWIQQQKLTASDGSGWDLFGSSVCLSNDTALIGAWGGDGNDIHTGVAYVFIHDNIRSIWTQQTKIFASDGEIGENFGYTVSLDKDTAVIGASGDGEWSSGSAYVFTRTGTIWAQQAKLLASDGMMSDYFGNAVSVDGNITVISAPYDHDNGIDSGSAYVFMQDGKAPNIKINISGSLGINVLFTNTGKANASRVEWRIHVQGGILARINKTANGIIDIPISGSVLVETGMFFGFGVISIMVKVADEEKTATGTQLIFFSIVDK